MNKAEMSPVRKTAVSLGLMVASVLGLASCGPDTMPTAVVSDKSVVTSYVMFDCSSAPSYAKHDFGDITKDAEITVSDHHFNLTDGRLRWKDHDDSDLDNIISLEDGLRFTENSNNKPTEIYTMTLAPKEDGYDFLIQGECLDKMK